MLSTTSSRLHSLYVLSFLFVLSILLSAPSIMRIPTMFPFVNPVVRQVAPVLLDELREKGWWLVHVDIVDIKYSKDGACMMFANTYVSRRHILTPDIVATCEML